MITKSAPFEKFNAKKVTGQEKNYENLKFKPLKMVPVIA